MLCCYGLSLLGSCFFPVETSYGPSWRPLWAFPPCLPLNVSFSYLLPTNCVLVARIYRLLYYCLHIFFLSTCCYFFFKIDIHVSVTETTRSAQCRLARVNACSWTPRGTWCLQTAAKQETPVRNWSRTPAQSQPVQVHCLHPPHRQLGKGQRVPAVSFSGVAASVEWHTVKL